MTTQAVEVFLQTQSGRALTLYNADLDDSAEEEVTSGGNGLNVVSGVSLGLYGTGEVVTHAICVGSDAMGYAYIENPDGSIAMPVSISSDAGINAGLVALHRPIRISSGMTFKARSLATNSLVVCLSTICASGRADIFTATASDGNTSNFSSLKSSQDVGKTLVGQTIIKAMPITQVGLNTGESGGSSSCALLDAQGATKAVWAQQNTQVTQPVWQQFNVRVAQNDKAQITYDAS